MHATALRVALVAAAAAAAVIAGPGTATSATAPVPRFGHVFLIVGENTSYAQITRKHAPYLTRTLEPRSARLTNYHSFTASSSLSQYIAMVSGLLDQLAGSGRSWRVWQESMPAPCYRRDTGRPSRHNEYTAHHNPAIYFTNLSASCRADNIPMGGTGAIDTKAFDRALAGGDVGDFNMVVPNDCENGHDPCGGDGVRHFDNFLAREVPRIERSPAFGRDGLIIVTWDEGGDPPHQPGHVLTVLAGPLVRRGAVNATRLDHYALERTLALGFGVTPLPHAAKAAPIAGVWR